MTKPKRNGLNKKRGRKLQQYDYSDLVKAVEAVRSNLMSIRKAAEAFHVHKSTICDKVTGRSEIDANIGRKPSLPKCVENKIAKNVVEASKRGMGVSRARLFQRTALLYANAFGSRLSKMVLPGEGGGIALKNVTQSMPSENQKNWEILWPGC